MGKIKILVVEDVAISQVIAKNIFTGLGCCVDIAKNGEEALSMFSTNQYDIVLMDLGLPDYDGMFVAKKMRMMQDKYFVPIVALTASFNQSRKSLCMAAGMNAFMVKPLTVIAARSIINQWVSHKSPHCAVSQYSQTA